MQGEVAAGGATPRAAGEEGREYSGPKSYLHHEFDREIAPGLAEIVAEALARGLLIGGGRFALRHGRLWREAGR